MTWEDIKDIGRALLFTAVAYAMAAPFIIGAAIAVRYTMVWLGIR